MNFFLLGWALLTFNFAYADSNESFRTPAKVYGSAYSIKLTLRRDGFTYDIPVWVKPDQKISSLDRDQLNDLGWIYKDNTPEEIIASGQPFDSPKFQNKKSDWAYLPDFAKACCYGIIGQDILREYEIKFDPNPPAHLEWQKISAEKPEKSEKADQYHKGAAKFQKSLTELFSLRSDRLARTAFTLNLSKNELRFDPEHSDVKAASKPLKTALFRYKFTPPKRFATVTAITSGYNKSAKEVGFKASIKVVSLNSFAVPALNHFEMNDLLTGKRSKTLTIKTNKDQVFIFDFEKNEFTQTTPVQSNPSRN